jgi:hypothetical protein
MALTTTRITGVRDTVIGNKKLVTRHVTFDSSYATGGEPLVPSDFGLKAIDSVIPAGPARKADGTSAVIPSYDHTNQKLMAYWSAGSGAAPTQVANATDLSTYTARLVVVGFGTG